jgi:hypothetical protein
MCNSKRRHGVPERLHHQHFSRQKILKKFVNFSWTHKNIRPATSSRTHGKLRKLCITPAFVCLT